MLFSSIDFAVFLPVVFGLYWLIGSRRVAAQNFFLLVASYVFYGWWDWRFLSLIFISSLTDYLVARGLERASSTFRRRLLMTLSLIGNLGLLGFFKYYGFFIENLVEAFTYFGKEIHPATLRVILPVGISFYTFQTLGYVIDVYRGKIPASRNLTQFLAFVSFFPQLVAGPIERASNLLPQFGVRRTFDYESAKDGLRQILWGLFKKIVIADTAAIAANEIFANYEHVSSTSLLLGAFYFAVQIYGDFSAYSDIAIGTAKLFGFRLMRNFAYPYFSRDIAEFWRRWHISLSTWFRDYVYIPLGGSRTSKAASIRNVFIVFIVSGFWHGANWTFVAWGGLNAVFFLPLMLAKTNRQHTGEIAPGRVLPSLKETVQIASTFALTLVAWVFFRSPSIGDAVSYIGGFLAFDFGPVRLGLLKFLPLSALLATWEWLMRSKEHGLAVDHLSLPLRWSLYLALCWLIAYFTGEAQEFIYFQF